MSYDIISQRCSPIASLLYSHKQQAEHKAANTTPSFFLSFKNFASALIIVVAAIIHYYNFIYNKNMSPVKLGVGLLAFILPQERSDRKLPWLLVLNAEPTSLVHLFLSFFSSQVENGNQCIFDAGGRAWAPTAWMWC